MMNFKILLIPAVLLALLGCNSNQNPTKADDELANKELPEDSSNKIKSIYNLQDSSKSGFYFVNELIQNEDYNVITYENYYNGAGVGLGDFNADGLLDIFMTGNFFGGRLYLNEGNFHFNQISEEANIFGQGYYTGVSIVDINGDGYDDIYLCRSLSSVDSLRKNVLLLNNQDNTFSRKEAIYKIDDSSYSNQSLFLDFDNDGDLDLYVLNHRKDFNNALTIYNSLDSKGNVLPSDSMWRDEYCDKLYRNDGGKFIDISKEAGIINNDFSLSAVATDLNNDGFVDIYISNDFISRDHAYINDGKGHFTDELEHRFNHIAHSAMGTDVGDINNDGFLDLVSVDMTPENNYRQKQLAEQRTYDSYKLAQSFGYRSQISRNMLHLNRGDGTFSEIGQLLNIAYTDWSWGALFLDFDNNGWEDLYITNGHYKNITDLDFKKYESEKIISEAGGISKVKNLDLINQMSQTKLPNYAFINQKGTSFSNEANTLGLATLSFSNGAAYGDFDNDGDLDLVVNNLNQEAFLYENLSNESQKEAHFISFSLSGDMDNIKGFGTQVYLFENGHYRLKECTPYRGFLSSSDPRLHFGLGSNKEVDSVLIIWPGGKGQKLTNLKVDTIINIDYSNAKLLVTRPKKSQTSPLVVEKLENNINFTHSENKFIDFKTQPLLEHFLSNNGPILQTGDLNNDGVSDIYIGGSKGFPAELYFGTAKGSFIKQEVDDFLLDAHFEDADCKFFDFDGDNLLDILVSSSGVEHFDQTENCSSRLYINNGDKNFSKLTDISLEQPSSSSIITIDYDADGDLDVFVGGYFLPNQYPMASQSKLFKNEDNKFTDVSDLLPKNGNLGCITDTKSFGKNQLVLVGEWNSILLLTFDSSESITLNTLPQTSGWWNCVSVGDIDNDGDLDLVAGNRGFNKSHRPQNGFPAKIYYGDFDNNGDLDAFPCYYFPTDKDYYTKHSLDEIFMQMTAIRKQYKNYKDFSNAKISDFIPANANYKEAATFASSVFINEGDGNFQMRELPFEFQFSYLKDLMLVDLNNDSHLDLISVGNNFDVDIREGQADASSGIIALGDGVGNFSVDQECSHNLGLFGRDPRSIKHLGDGKFIISNNRGSLSFVGIRPRQ